MTPTLRWNGRNAVGNGPGHYAKDRYGLLRAGNKKILQIPRWGDAAHETPAWDAPRSPDSVRDGPTPLLRTAPKKEDEPNTGKPLSGDTKPIGGSHPCASPVCVPRCLKFDTLEEILLVHF